MHPINFPGAVEVGVKPKDMRNQTDEKYIIELIREGKANKEIADVIHKSITATENIIHRLLRKHNCRNRVQLALKDTEVPRVSMET